MGGRNGVLIIAAAAAMLMATPAAEAAVSCEVTGSSTELSVVASSAGDSVRVVRDGTAIGVHANGVELECGNGTPNLATIESASLVDESAGATEWTVDLGGGQFVPGLMDEGDGSSEIEMVLQGGTGDDLLVVAGGSGADDIRVGTDAPHPWELVNLNAGETTDDDDVRAIDIESIEVEGNDGNDVLNANGGADTGAPADGHLELHGGAGSDTLTASDTGSRLVGGSEPDLLNGGAGADVAEARDGSGDVITCSGGADVAQTDRPGIDTVKDCETVDTGPGGSTASGGGPIDPRAESGVDLVESGLEFPSTELDFAPPVIRGAKLAKRSFKTTVATTLRFRLSEAAWVDLAVRRVLRSGKTRAAGETSADLAAGAHALRFAPAGLPRGRYRLVLVAFDVAGNRALPVTLRFRVR